MAFELSYRFTVDGEDFLMVHDGDIWPDGEEECLYCQKEIESTLCVSQIPTSETKDFLDPADILRIHLRCAAFMVRDLADAALPSWWRGEAWQKHIEDDDMTLRQFAEELYIDLEEQAEQAVHRDVSFFRKEEFLNLLAQQDATRTDEK